MVEATRRFVKSGRVFVCNADKFHLYGLKHLQLHLPEYDNYQLAVDSMTMHPPGKPMWRSRSGLLESVVGVDLETRKGIVFLVPSSQDIGIFKEYVSLTNITCLTDGANNLYFPPIRKVRWRHGGLVFNR